MPSEKANFFLQKSIEDERAEVSTRINNAEDNESSPSFLICKGLVMLLFKKLMKKQSTMKSE